MSGGREVAALRWEVARRETAEELLEDLTGAVGLYLTTFATAIHTTTTPPASDNGVRQLGEALGNAAEYLLKVGRPGEASPRASFDEEARTIVADLAAFSEADNRPGCVVARGWCASCWGEYAQACPFCGGPLREGPVSVQTEHEAWCVVARAKSWASRRERIDLTTDPDATPLPTIARRSVHPDALRAELAGWKAGST